jgi:molybdopterin/thiamine biosynthesis adenylyltransferase
MAKVAIDVEGVLWDAFAIPVLGGIELCVALKKAGHTVILHTDSLDDREKIEEWLKDYAVPYDDLVVNKIQASVYVSRRGFRWNESDCFDMVGCGLVLSLADEANGEE